MSLRKFKRNRKSKKPATDPVAAAKIFARGIEYKRQGDHNRAEFCFRRTIKHAPQHGEAWNNLGNILHSHGKLKEALTCYKKCCEVLPDTAICFFNYGTCLHEIDDPLGAEKQLAQAVRLQPDYVEAYIALGTVRRIIGDTDGAVKALQQALTMQPEWAEPHRTLGLALKDRGDIDAGLKCFRKSLEYSPDNALSHYLITRYKKFQSLEDPDIDSFHLLLQKADLSPENALLLHFGLGKIYDDLGLYQKAFHHYQHGNRLKRESMGVGWVTTGIELDRYRKIFQASLFKRFAPPPDIVSSEIPVFIVGMPRSGTTLVEQICATHSQVYGKGELKMITKLIDELPKQCKGKAAYPECLLTVSPSLIHSLAKKYINELSTGVSEETTRIIDKMPSNFRELGLIAILFPKARIIHCTRNPLDTCLSNFFQNFEEGNECSFDIDTLTLYYRKYVELMKFWNAVLPINLHTVHYENLVSHPEEESKKLIEYLGLDWEENCLNFHKTKRKVQTSSDWQVRQPLYKRSVARWKNYEPYVKEFVEGLESKSRLI